MSGTVYVDNQGRVRRMVTNDIWPLSTKGTATDTFDVTFGDFGVRVSVTAPPASQVTRDKGYVEWYLIPW